MAYREMMSVVLEKQAGVTAEVDFMRLMECLSHRSRTASDAGRSVDPAGGNRRRVRERVVMVLILPNRVWIRIFKLPVNPFSQFP